MLPRLSPSAPPRVPRNIQSIDVEGLKSGLVRVTPQPMERPSWVRLLVSGAAGPLVMSLGAGVASAGAAALTLLGAAQGGLETAQQSASLAWHGHWGDAASVAARQGAEIGLGVVGGLAVSGAYAGLSAALLLTAPATWGPSALANLATGMAAGRGR